MELGILHLHVTLVVLFLGFFMVKLALLMLGKKDILNRIRSRFKIVDIILGTLILLTGVFLLTLKQNFEFYMVTKIVLMLIAIPLGIVGMKRGRVALSLSSIIIFAYIYVVAETRSAKFKMSHIVIEYDENISEIEQGKIIFNVLCVECHGQDGKKSLFNAPNLTSSKLSESEKRNVITNGRKVMPKYKDDLHEEEIEKLLKYIQTLN